MAQKRMFSLSVVDTDKFLEMPVSARLLYYELGMRADDDGFVNNWKKILTFTGLKDDDIKILIAKQFIIPFDSGVIVIKHWRLNNYLQNDRTKPTIYQDEFKQLGLDENNVYTMDTTCIHSIDKNRIVENSIDKNRFIPPTLEEVSAYCKERNNNVNPERFIDFYESKGWLVGKSKMKDWKASVRTWERDTNTTKEIKREDMPSWVNDPIKESSKEDEEEFDDILSTFK